MQIIANDNDSHYDVFAGDGDDDPDDSISDDYERAGGGYNTSVIFV